MQFDDLLTTDLHESGSEMQIRHPGTGELTGVYLLLKGVDSKTFRRALAEFNRKSMDKGADREALSIDLLVAVTDSWRGVKDGEQDKPFSKDAIRKLYTDSPAVRQQADAWIADRRNFTKG